MSVKKNSLKGQAGFTLLELMVVIVILGVLASMVVPNLMGNKEKADAQKATSDIVALEGSLDMYKLAQPLDFIQMLNNLVAQLQAHRSVGRQQKLIQLIHHQIEIPFNQKSRMDAGMPSPASER